MCQQEYFSAVTSHRHPSSPRNRKNVASLTFLYQIAESNVVIRNSCLALNLVPSFSPLKSPSLSLKSKIKVSELTAMYIYALYNSLVWPTVFVPSLVSNLTNSAF